MAYFRYVLQGISNKTFAVSTVSSQCSSFLTSSFMKNMTMHNQDSVRFTHSFFNRLSAEKLWKGVTSVSNAGRRKGRGRNLKRVAKDLNRGQVTGIGKINMLFPGLNAPVVRGKEVLHLQQLPPDEDREKKLYELRDKMAGKRRFKIHPLERGWSGTKLPGRSLGPPDPLGEETFEGFDSRVLQFKGVTHMTGQRGRVRSLSALVVVGNKNGLAGFAVSKSVIGMSAARSAKNRAAKLLRYIPRDGDTVVHDFHCEFGANHIFVKKQPKGYGLVCHRAIKAICEMVGIKDLYAKADGPTRNTQNLTKAFFIGLFMQKSYQQLANEKRLHIVESRADRDNFPVIMASPDNGDARSEAELGPTEQLDWTLHLLHGKVERPRKKFEPFYVNFPSYIHAMESRQFMRNHRAVTVDLLVKYGKKTSFLLEREEEKKRQEEKLAVEAKE